MQVKIMFQSYLLIRDFLSWLRKCFAVLESLINLGREFHIIGPDDRMLRSAKHFLLFVTFRLLAGYMPLNSGYMPLNM